MSGRRLEPCRGAAALLTVLSALSAKATAGPTQLGRVFELRHSAVVAARVGTRWEAGFVIGARGELLLGGRELPARFRVRSADGELHWAQRLAKHPRWPLALARVEGWHATPLAVGPRTRFRKEMWAMVLSIDDEGRPEPFAGVFLEDARAPDASAALMSTGQPGAAILDTGGRLIGVAVTRGRRETRVVSFARLRAFVLSAGYERADVGE